MKRSTLALALSAAFATSPGLAQTNLEQKLQILQQEIDGLKAQIQQVQAVGSSGDKFILRTATGTFASADAVAWQRATDGKISWSQPAPLSEADLRRFRDILTPGIPVQQVLLDLHSGRIFGRYGELFVDPMAGILATLSLIGGWLFFMPRQRRESH